MYKFLKSRKCKKKFKLGRGADKDYKNWREKIRKRQSHYRNYTDLQEHCVRHNLSEEYHENLNMDSQRLKNIIKVK